MGLKLSLSFCAKCHDSVVKSQLLRHSHTTRHNHYHGSSPQKEKPRFAKKHFSLCAAGFLGLCCSSEHQMHLGIIQTSLASALGFLGFSFLRKSP